MPERSDLEKALPTGEIIFQEQTDDGPPSGTLTQFPNGVFAIVDPALITPRLAAYLSFIREHEFEIDQVILTDHYIRETPEGQHVIRISDRFNGAIILATRHRNETPRLPRLP